MRSLEDQILFMKPKSLALLVWAFLLLFSGSPALAGAVSAEGFKAWLSSFRTIAVKEGIRPEVYDAVTRGLTPDFSLPDLDLPSRAGKGPGQPEFIRTPEQY